MPRGAPTRAAATAVAAALVLAPAVARVAGSDAAPGCAGVRARADGWHSIPAPAGFAPVGVTRYAVGSADGSVLVVTDGRAVARSVDGGCSWSPLLTGDVVAVPGVAEVELQRVVDLEASGARLYVAAEVVVGDVRRTSVLSSDDGGATWDAGALGLGLPLLGDDADLAVSAVDDATAFLTVDADVEGRGVYATSDGGRTWSRRTAPLESADAVTALEVDPRDPSVLLAHGESGVLRSVDGGATFAPVAGAPGAPVVDLDVAPAAGSLRVVAAPPAAAVLRSDDGGTTWRQQGSPVTPHSVATTPALDVVAVSGEGQVALLVGDAVIGATPADASPTDLELVVGPAGVRLLGRAGRDLMRRDFTPRRRTPKAGLADVELRAAAPTTQREPLLNPRAADLVLLAGTARTVPYTLDVPAAPTALDLVFLVDTTGSMGGVIAGLRRGMQQIVNDVAASGVDAQFAVAEFKDYPLSPWSSEPDVPYRRLRAIGPVDESLERAIEELTASGGGDLPESALTGLLQAVTGAGDVRGGISPGQDVRFRPDALRVVVTITDERFHREPDYPGPTFPVTARALRDRQVLQVGLAVNGGGRSDLVEMATATGALAPPGGVDCDRDGRVDVAPGAAMVCDVGDSDLLGVVDNSLVDLGRAEVSIAPAVVALVRSVRDTATVELQSQRPERGRVVGRAAFAGVDAKRAQRLRFLVRFDCPEIPRGGEVVESTVPLRAVRRDVVLATAATRLRCVPLPAQVTASEELPPRALLPVVAAALAPPPPAPPALITQAQPNPNSNPQANPQPQLQTQAGLAVAEQQRTELAAAGADDEQQRDGEQELAMSARSREDDDHAAATLLALASFGVASATALARRRRTECVPVRR